MKRHILENANTIWDGSIWRSQGHYDLPGMAIVKKLPKFPYIGNPRLSFDAISKVEQETRDQLAFLQVTASGKPVVAGTWFHWADEALDIHSDENFMLWQIPEIEPRVQSCSDCHAEHLKRSLEKFAVLPEALRTTLMRSINRFVLSQCRHQLVDQALDLAIAFEIALGGGAGDNAPPSWKVGFRSAQMIGGEIAARREIRETMGDLYKIRNKASHGSSVKTADLEEFRDVLARSVAVYRTLLESFLLFGEIPDWQILELEPRVKF